MSFEPNLDWHRTVFHQSVGDVVDVPMGSLRMRALLAGFGYRHRIHRFTALANASAGYSFNHLTDDSGLGPAFARTGVSLIDVHVNDSAMTTYAGIRALNLAEAMEARGYGRPGRTVAPGPPWRRADRLAIALAVIVVVGGILWL